MSLHETPELSRLDALLMRVLDDEATLEEREELLELADADARLAEQFELRFALRETLLGGETADSIASLEIVGAVLAALSIDDDWAPLADGLRDALSEAAPAVSLADAVMAEVVPAEDRAAIAISALFDGELSPEERKQFAATAGRAELDALNAHAELSGALRGAVAARTAGADLFGVWEGVAPAIGLEDPHEIPGWETVGAAIREAVMARAELPADAAKALTDRVMDGLPRPVVEAEPEPEVAEVPELDRGWQRWVSALFGPVAVLAMALLLFMPNAFNNKGNEATTPPPGPAIEEVAELSQPETDEVGALELSEENHAEVESLEYAEDVIVQVIQQEDDAPLFVWIDEPVDEGATL